MENILPIARAIGLSLGRPFNLRLAPASVNSPKNTSCWNYFASRASNPCWPINPGSVAMSRQISRSTFCLAFLFNAINVCQAIYAQGVLVVVTPDDHIRLPPPWLPHPPHPWPQPQPEPPTATYKSMLWRLTPGLRIRWPKCRFRSRSSTPAAGRWKSRSCFRFPTTGPSTR